jgi:hypothetical protein
MSLLSYIYFYCELNKKSQQLLFSKVIGTSVPAKNFYQPSLVDFENISDAD